MGELVQWSEAARGGVDRCAALANQLQQRRLQALFVAGIPDVVHTVNILVTDPQTGWSCLQGWEFHGPVLAAMNIPGGAGQSPTRLQVILGVTGELLEVHTDVWDPDRPSRWNPVTEQELAENPKLACQVLEGFDGLLEMMRATIAAEPDRPDGVIAFPVPRGMGSPDGGYSA